MIWSSVGVLVLVPAVSVLRRNWSSSVGRTECPRWWRGGEEGGHHRGAVGAASRRCKGGRKVAAGEQWRRGGVGGELPVPNMMASAPPRRTASVAAVVPAIDLQDGELP
jgi:hypothetical protein